MPKISWAHIEMPAGRTQYLWDKTYPSIRILNRGNPSIGINTNIRLLLDFAQVEELIFVRQAKFFKDHGNFPGAVVKFQYMRAPTHEEQGGRDENLLWCSTMGVKLDGLEV